MFLDIMCLSKNHIFSLTINKDLITYAKPEAIKAIISHFNITE